MARRIVLTARQRRALYDLPYEESDLLPLNDKNGHEVSDQAAYRTSD